LQQQRPLVTFGLVGDLLEEPAQRGADALVARKSRRYFASAQECRNDVVAVDGQIRDREGRLPGKLGVDARLEPFVAVVAFRQAAAPVELAG
jgi:hypothetical protein